jgi:peptide/nickel transport system ATP-binding protein
VTAPILSIRDLLVELEDTGRAIVELVSIEVRRGEIVALVGESGSGKTTAALAALGYARPGVRIGGGEILVADKPILRLPPSRQRRLRGRLISYVPQDPGSSLNPGMRVGDQVATVLREHFPSRGSEAEVEAVLKRVGLPSDRAFRRRYPHQLSGGQQQRVAIAVALACDPAVVVFDEPTTALDVITQAGILSEIDRLRRENEIAMIYVSHDLAVVATLADRIAVMYAGRIVEEAATAELLARPRHPYTRALLSSIPDHASSRRLRGIEGTAPAPGERSPGCAFAPRCSLRVAHCTESVPQLEAAGHDHLVRCFEWERTPPIVVEPSSERVPGAAKSEPLLRVEALSAVHEVRGGSVVAVQDVSFAIRAGEAVALVGESGSGKTTIARCVVGLHAPFGGRILLDGRPLPPLATQRPREALRRVQMVFQNPYESLNPRWRIGDGVARSAQVLCGLRRAAAEREAAELLARVRLPAAMFARYPSELSGGERQRVAIARALGARPELLVCDEITSALDVSVQAAVVELLEELRSEMSLSLLFISHDLALVASVTDRVLVLEHGILREEGEVRRLLAAPTDPYTQQLVAAVPRLPELERA